MAPSFRYSGSTVTIGDRSWEVRFPIRDARFLDGRVLLIYDYVFGPQDAAFHNLEAFNTSGQKQWTAENPGADPADAYVEFISEIPLVVWNFACFRCTIDPKTGKLLKAVFTK